MRDLSHKLRLALLAVSFYKQELKPKEQNLKPEEAVNFQSAI